MELEKRLGFRSSFFFVPGDYEVPPGLRAALVAEGFEIGIHGIKHDGRTFLKRKTFEKRAPKIDHFLKEWGAVGYSSPSTLRKLDWIAELNIEYDCSTFDTDPFEPQPNGMGTIFPFPVVGPSGSAKFIEIPYTLPQDHSLFVILNERTIDIWKEKVDWIAENGGVAVLNTHPDYMDFQGSRYSHKAYPARNYMDFLEYVKAKHLGRYWHVLPRDLAGFWREFLHSSHKSVDTERQVEGSGPSTPPHKSDPVED
jgi:peptidoglycan/xylan/chitin deacetylase (PgdA/CDA1 family)